MDEILCTRMFHVKKKQTIKPKNFGKVFSNYFVESDS